MGGGGGRTKTAVYPVELVDTEAFRTHARPTVLADHRAGFCVWHAWHVDETNIIALTNFASASCPTASTVTHVAQANAVLVAPISTMSKIGKHVCFEQNQ